MKLTQNLCNSEFKMISKTLEPLGPQSVVQGRGAVLGRCCEVSLGGRSFRPRRSDAVGGSNDMP